MNENKEIKTYSPGSLSHTLLTAFITLTISVVLIVTTVSIWNSQSIIQAQVVAHFSSVAALKQTRVETWLGENIRFLRTVITSSAVDETMLSIVDNEPTEARYNQAGQQLQQNLRKQLAVSQQFIELFILDIDGKVVASTEDEHVGQMHLYEPYFIQGIRSTYVEAPYYDPTAKRVVTILALPITHQEQTLGVAVGRLGLAQMQEIMLEAEGLGKTGETYLVNSDKIMVTASRFADVPEYQHIDTEGVKSALGHTSNYALYRNYRGKPVIGVYRWIPELQVALMVEQEQREIFAGIRRTVVFNLGIGTLVTLLAAIAAVIITRFITDPLERLTDIATRMAEGDLNQEARIRRADEIGILANAFNTMTIRLRELVSGLEERVAERTAELEQRALQLETSSQVGRQVTSILELGELLTEIVNLIQQRFGYYFVGVWLVTERKDAISLKAGTGEAGTQLRERQFLISLNEPSIVGKTCVTGKYRAVADVLEDPDYMPLEVLPHTRAELALPLLIGQKVIGVLEIHSEQPRAFKVDSLMVLQLLANQIAVAIRNAQLYQSEQQRRQFAESLEQTGRAVTSNLNMREVPQRVLEELVTVVPYDRGAIMLQQGSRIVVLARRGFPPQCDEQALFIPIRDGDVYEKLVQTRNYMLIDDVTTKPEWHQIPSLPVHKSWLGVPLIARGHVIGMISLTRSEANAFSEREARMVLTFAGQAAIALENARLYSELSAINKELEAFAYSVSHDLRAPLRSIDGFSQALLEDYRDKIDEYGQDYLQRVRAASQRMAQMIDDLLRLSRITRQEVQHELVDLSALARATIKELRCREPTRQVEVIIANGIVTQGDSGLLQIVIENLLENAWKFTSKCEHAVVEFGFTQDNGSKTYFVRDNGAGFDMEYSDRMFAVFQRLHRKAEFEGTGIGLATVQRIIHRHGGRIWAEGEVDKGATIYFTL